MTQSISKHKQPICRCWCGPSIQSWEIVLLGSKPCPCPATNCIYTKRCRPEWWRSVWGPTTLQPWSTHIHPARCIMEMRWTRNTHSITILHHVLAPSRGYFRTLMLNFRNEDCKAFHITVARRLSHLGLWSIDKQLLVKLGVWVSVWQNVRQLAFCPCDLKGVCSLARACFIAPFVLIIQQRRHYSTYLVVATDRPTVYKVKRGRTQMIQREKGTRERVVVLRGQSRWQRRSITAMQENITAYYPGIAWCLHKIKEIVP